MENHSELIEMQLSEIRTLLAKAKKAIKPAPPGTIQTSRSNGRYQYYLYDKSSNTRKYLHSFETSQASAIIQNEYLNKIIKQLECQKLTMERFLAQYNPTVLDEVYNNTCDSKRVLINPLIPTPETLIAQWYLNNPGGLNPYPITDKHITNKNEFVRSKSEKILADHFNHLGIAYVCEPRLDLGFDGEKYPDFALFNLNQKKTYYWEHFGLSDLEQYAFKNMKKLAAYERHGIKTGDNLIISFETNDHPLDLRIVDEKLRQFIL